MKRKNIFWGLILIFISITLLADMTGVIEAHSTFKLAWTIILIAFAISKIIALSFIPASLAGAMVLTLNADKFTVYPSTPMIFFASFLLGLGLSMIFKPMRRRKIIIKSSKNRSFKTNFQSSISGEHVHFENNFGDNSRYVQSNNLKSASIENNLGHSRVYFDNVVFDSDGAIINVECNLGQVTLYLPSDINLQNNLTASLGSITGAQSFHQDDSYPTVFLEGESNLGQIDVIIL